MLALLTTFLLRKLSRKEPHGTCFQQICEKAISVQHKRKLKEYKKTFKKFRKNTTKFVVQTKMKKKKRSERKIKKSFALTPVEIKFLTI